MLKIQALLGLTRLIGLLIVLLSLVFFLILSQLLNRITPLKYANFHKKIIVTLEFWHVKALLLMTGVKVRATIEGSPETPCLIVANHISYVDVLAIAGVLPTSFMAKSEVEEWGLISSVIKYSNGIFVNRDCRVSRVKAMFELVSTLKNRNMCVFPEGSTTAHEPPTSQVWQRGAFAAAHRAKSALLVLGISYEDRENTPWIGEMSFLPHFWATICRPTTRVAIVGKYYSSKSIITTPIREMAETARKDVADSLHTGTSYFLANRGGLQNYATS